MMATKDIKKQIIEKEENDSISEDIINSYKLLDEKCEATLKKIKNRRAKNGKKE